MFTLRVTKSEREYVQDAKAEHLKVSVEILEDGKMIEERSFGYPLITTAAEIKEDLQKFIQNYTAEKEQAIANAEHEAELKQSDETMEALKDLEVAPADADTAKEEVAGGEPTEPAKEEGEAK